MAMTVLGRTGERTARAAAEVDIVSARGLAGLLQFRFATLMAAPAFGLTHWLDYR
jgi:hypothetical protein